MCVRTRQQLLPTIYRTICQKHPPSPTCSPPPPMFLCFSPRNLSHSQNPSSSMCHRAYGIRITHHAFGRAAAHYCWHSRDSGSTHSVSSLFLATSLSTFKYNVYLFGFDLFIYHKIFLICFPLLLETWHQRLTESLALALIAIISPGRSSKTLSTGFFRPSLGRLTNLSSCSHLSDPALDDSQGFSCPSKDFRSWENNCGISMLMDNWVYL